METDIRGATELELQAYLVLTGSTRAEDVAAYPYQPTRILDTIADLVIEQPEKQEEPESLLPAA
jgi:NagD protein